MNNNKAIKVISIFCVLGIIILIFIFFSEIYKTKDYIKADAIITANIENTDLGLTNDSKSTKYKYVEVKYGNYTNKYRVWTFLMKGEGSSTTIYYSKDNPNLIRDKFKMTTTIIGTIFLSVFLLGINLAQSNTSHINSENMNKKSSIKF